MNKLLTVIIPTYNMEAYLGRCLSSLMTDEAHLEQLEVLVINDGSTDHSSAIAHRHAGGCPGTFRVIDKENGNYGSCINRGLSEATGLYVKILDAEDYFDTAHIGAFMDLLETGGADLILSAKKDLIGDKEMTQRFGLPTGHPFSPDDIPDNVTATLFMHAMTYRKELLTAMGYRQTEHISYTDLEWAYYPMKNVRTVRYFDETVYCYNTSRTGQTISPASHCRNMWMETGIIRRMMETAAGQPAESAAERYMQRRLYHFTLRVYNYYLLEYPRLLRNEDLAALDRVCAESTPALHSALGGEILVRRLLPAYRYIDAWRRRGSRRTLMFVLYDMYAFTVEHIALLNK